LKILTDKNTNTANFIPKLAYHLNNLAEKTPIIQNRQYGMWGIW